jgi:hypothetical protein
MAASIFLFLELSHQAERSPGCPAERERERDRERRTKVSQLTASTNVLPI